MRGRLIPIAATTTLAALPIVSGPAYAMQDIAIAGRAGTLGLGAEVVIVANDWIALRGGAGLLGFDADITSVSGLEDNRTGEVGVPKSVYTFGADIAVGNFRLGGGMLYKQADPTYAIKLGSGAEIDIGANTYTEPEVTQLTTTLVSEAWAPYVLLGFGQHMTRGVGIFLDVGVAFLDQSDLELSATGDQTVLTSRRFREDLRAERRNSLEDAGDLVNYWPILNLGLEFAVGGRGRGRRGGW